MLEAIERKVGRDSIDFGDLAGLHGSDVWHLYELSWLTDEGYAENRVGVLTIPASTPRTVESKSLKLYLNSLNFKRFASSHTAAETIESDLETVVGGPVQLTLLTTGEINQITREPAGKLLDQLSLPPVDAPDMATLAQGLSASSEFVDGRYLTHRLRSLCPVTGQPDWATLVIQLRGRELDFATLMAYVAAYREHPEFHEQCVERIFADLWRALAPERLVVSAFYTRRGGIDITPWRSNLAFIAPSDRMGRQ